MSLELEDIEIAGVEDHPVTDSVKLHGPPGTGKTTQSAARVARLIRDEGYDISNVTWVTYRRSLADDTLARLHRWGVVPDEEMEDPKSGATRNIGTYHAVGHRLIREDVEIVAGNRNKNHRHRFCDEIADIEYRTDGRRESSGQMMFDAFEYMAENLIDPTDGNGLQQCEPARTLTNQGFDLAGRWEEWQYYKERNGLIDFHEMLTRPLERGYSPDTDILVVDEYHDAVPLYAALAKQWAEEHDVVIVAGDPHQVVNSYQGASPEYFEEIPLPRVLLDKTYRVPVEHLATAHRILSRAHSPPEVATTKNGRFADGKSPKFYYRRSLGRWDVPDEDERLSPAWIINEFGEDTMFLTRTRRQATAIAVALEQAGLLYTTQSNVSGGWGPGNDGRNVRAELFNGLQKIRGLSPGDFKSNGLAAYDTGIGSGSTKKTLTAEEYSSLMAYANASTLETGRDDVRARAAELREEDAKIALRQLADEVTPEFWKEYARGRRSVENLNRGRMSDRDREALKAALERYDYPVGDASAVKTQILTIHASKGGEAHNVALYDGVTNKIENEMVLKDSVEKNEHRTWYVGLTRAEDTLMILRDAFPWTQSYLPDDLKTTAARAVEGGA